MSKDHSVLPYTRLETVQVFDFTLECDHFNVATDFTSTLLLYTIVRMVSLWPLSAS